MTWPAEEQEVVYRNREYGRLLARSWNWLEQSRSKKKLKPTPDSSSWAGVGAFALGRSSRGPTKTCTVEDGCERWPRAWAEEDVFYFYIFQNRFLQK